MMLMQNCFLILKNRIQPKCPLLGNKFYKLFDFIHWNTMQPLKKEWSRPVSMVKDDRGILIKGKNIKFQEMFNPTYLEVYMYKKTNRQKSRRLHTKLLTVSISEGVGGTCVWMNGTLLFLYALLLFECFTKNIFMYYWEEMERLFWRHCAKGKVEEAGQRDLQLRGLLRPQRRLR